MSDSLQPHGLQHTMLPCPSPFPIFCSNSGPLNWCCHPIISSSAAPFSCPQSFPTSGSIPMSLLFTSGGQIIGAWASASVLPVNIQGWFPLGWTDSCLENSMNSMKREVSRKSFSICQARHELKTCLFNNPSPPIHIQRKEREKGRKGGREKDGEIPNHLGEHSVQFSSVAQSYLTLCDPVNRSTPGLPVHHQLPEFTQTHVHR